MDTVEELNVSQIAYHTVNDYNRIARGNDKIW